MSSCALRLISLPAILHIVACSDDPLLAPDPPPLAGPPFLDAQIRGEHWEPTDPGEDLLVFFGTQRIAITARRHLAEAGTWEELQFELESPIPPEAGSYELAKGPEAFATFTTFVFGQIEEMHTTTGTRGGTLTISAMSNAQRRMTGTFSFRATKLDGSDEITALESFRVAFPD